VHGPFWSRNTSTWQDSASASLQFCSSCTPSIRPRVTKQTVSGTVDVSWPVQSCLEAQDGTVWSSPRMPTSVRLKRQTRKDSTLHSVWRLRVVLSWALPSSVLDCSVSHSCSTSSLWGTVMPARRNVWFMPATSLLDSDSVPRQLHFLLVLLVVSTLRQPMLVLILLVRSKWISPKTTLVTLLLSLTMLATTLVTSLEWAPTFSNPLSDQSLQPSLWPTEILSSSCFHSGLLVQVSLLP